MQSFLLNLETEFYFLTGMDLEGFSGLVFGLLIFCLILFLIRFEKKREPLIHDVDLSNVGTATVTDNCEATMDVSVNQIPGICLASSRVRMVFFISRS